MLELTSNTLKSEAKAILSKAGLEDADVDILIPGMVAGLEKVEDVQARANAYVDFAIAVAKELDLFEDEADVKETIEFWKNYKRMQ